MARLLEDRSKKIFSNYGIKTPKGKVITSPSDITLTPELGNEIVLKALVPVGGRGKLGAVKFASDSTEAQHKAKEIMEMEVGGYPIEGLLLEQQVEIESEFFASITYDDAGKCPIVLFSRQGGMDIETLAQEHPGEIIKKKVDIRRGFESFQAREMCDEAGIKAGNIFHQVSEILSRMYQILIDYDAKIVEINPLALTSQGELVAIDAVIALDGQAHFRHPDLFDPEDILDYGRPLTKLEQQIVKEVPDGSIRFREFQIFNDGNIGCFITGGGGSLMSVDLILHYGGTPATYVDITPGRKSMEEESFIVTKAILFHPNVKSLVVGSNITAFVRVDLRIKGVLRALREMDINLDKFPIVVRLSGTGEEKAREIIKSTPEIEYYPDKTMEEAIERIVELTEKG